MNRHQESNAGLADKVRRTVADTRSKVIPFTPTRTGR